MFSNCCSATKSQVEISEDGLGICGICVVSEFNKWCIASRGAPIPRTIEISEDWAWIVFFNIKRMPTQLNDKDKFRIEKAKLEGYSAVKCKIIIEEKATP